VWVVIALCSLVALTALALSIPVDVDLRVDVHGRASAHGRVEWLFGRVGTAFGAGEGGAKPSKPGKPKAEKKPKKRRAGLRNGRLAWDLLHVQGLLRTAVRLVVRLLRCIKVRTLRVDFRVDLGDPADTAMLVGPLAQAAMFADIWSPWSFRLMPAFDGTLLDGEAELAARLRPIAVVFPLLGFLFSASTLRAIVVVVRSRWKKDA
jgi:hypothetical protein